MITSPIFIVYRNGKIAAFEHLNEAELVPREHHALIEEVWDARGQRLEFGVGQTYAPRLLPKPSDPEPDSLDDLLRSALFEAGDLRGADASLTDLVAEAGRTFAVRTKENASVGLGQLFADILNGVLLNL